MLVEWINEVRGEMWENSFQLRVPTSHRPIKKTYTVLLVLGQPLRLGVGKKWGLVPPQDRFYFSWATVINSNGPDGVLAWDGVERHLSDFWFVFTRSVSVVFDPKVFPKLFWGWRPTTSTTFSSARRRRSENNAVGKNCYHLGFPKRQKNFWSLRPPAGLSPMRGSKIKNY